MSASRERARKRPARTDGLYIVYAERRRRRVCDLSDSALPNLLAGTLTSTSTKYFPVSVLAGRTEAARLTKGKASKRWAILSAATSFSSSALAKVAIPSSCEGPSSVAVKTMGIETIEPGCMMPECNIIGVSNAMLLGIHAEV